MSEESAKLRLPYIAASQAQKHVTHNEALTLLDTLVQASVIDKDLTTPPVSPDEGDCYIVAAGGTGDWIGWDNRIARYIDGEWRSYLPGAGDGEGWLVYVQDEGALYVFTGSAWQLVFNAAIAALAALASTDGNFIVGNGMTWVAESGDTARTSLGLGTGDSPRFTQVIAGPSGAAAVSRLTVVDEGISARGLTVAYHQSSIAGALFTYLKSRGTRASPATVASGDYGGFFAFSHHDGTAYRTNAYIGTRTSGAVGTNSIPTEVFFSVSATNDSDPYGGGTVKLSIKSDGSLQHNNAVTFVSANSHLSMRSYTVATLPSAATAGQWIYVSDESGGATPAFSDGSVWKRVSDLATVS